ncbi:MAG TPA: zinc ribbon domain-containing protein [Phycisphaerae bacterium]|nr:zinc ribbon domain-containing protein [Phycisphaerae bacterium]
MPLLEFHCSECDKDFEELVRDSAKPSVTCPACRSRKLTRRLSLFSARGQAPKKESVPAGGCGRCGDPAGPCGM